MQNFIKSIKETIESNKEELASPSRHYKAEELLIMQGYTRALNDVLTDYESELMDSLNKISLN
jgi:hypothetical protein